MRIVDGTESLPISADPILFFNQIEVDRRDIQRI